MASRYYKITNKDETHHGYKYQDGLNILDKPFDEIGTSASSGLYFTTIEHVPKFYRLGIHLREVHLPIDDPEFKIVRDPSGGFHRANKIILGKKYSLFEKSTYEKFGLDPTKNKFIIDYASMYGRIDVLNSWAGENLWYSIWAINWASEYGQIRVLEWWRKQCKLKLKYSEHAIDAASGNGRVNILNWWLNSGLDIKFSECAIDWASGNGKIRSLEWWQRICVPPLLEMQTKWWHRLSWHPGKDLNLKPLYTGDAIGGAAINGHIHILEWWLGSSINPIYISDAIDAAEKHGQPEIANWLREKINLDD